MKLVSLVLDERKPETEAILTVFLALEVREAYLRCEIGRVSRLRSSEMGEWSNGHVQTEFLSGKVAESK